MIVVGSLMLGLVFCEFKLFWAYSSYFAAYIILGFVYFTVSCAFSGYIGDFVIL